MDATRDDPWSQRGAFRDHGSAATGAAASRCAGRCAAGRAPGALGAAVGHVPQTRRGLWVLVQVWRRAVGVTERVKRVSAETLNGRDTYYMDLALLAGWRRTTSDPGGQTWLGQATAARGCWRGFGRTTTRPSEGPSQAPTLTPGWSGGAWRAAMLSWSVRAMAGTSWVPHRLRRPGVGSHGADAHSDRSRGTWWAGVSSPGKGFRSAKMQIAPRAFRARILAWLRVQRGRG